MNVDALVAEIVQDSICSFSIEKRTPCAPSILQGKFTMFIENGTELGAAIRILDEEQQKYYEATITQFDDDGIGFKIVDLEGKDEHRRD